MDYDQATKYAQVLGGFIPGAGYVVRNAPEIQQAASHAMTALPLGVQQLGANIANVLPGVDNKDYRNQLADAVMQNDQSDHSSGVPGFLGHVTGNPATLAAILLSGGAGALPEAEASVAPLATRIANAIKTGFVGGATQGSVNTSQDPNSGILTNLKNAGIDGVIGSGLGVGFETLPSAVSFFTQKAGGLADRLKASFGDTDAANNVAASIAAKSAIRGGDDINSVTSALAKPTNSALTPTYGEVLQNPAMYGNESALLRSDDVASKNMRDFVRNRSNNTIPTALNNIAQPLVTAGEQASPLYKAAANEADNATPEAREFQFNTLQDLRNKVSNRLDDLNGLKNDPEKDALDNIKNRLDVAKNRGDSYTALTDTMQQIDRMYSPGGAPIAKRDVVNYANGIDGVLGKLAPENYPQAKTAYMQGLAAKDIKDAVATSNKGDVGGIYDKLWAYPEDQANLLRKIPQDQQQDYSGFFNDLGNVADGHNKIPRASASQSNLNNQIQGYNGGFLNIARLPQAIGDKISGLYNPEIRQAMVRQATTLDPKILDAMNSTGVQIPSLSGAILPTSVNTAGYGASSVSPYAQEHEEFPSGFIPSQQHEAFPQGFIPQGAK